MDTPLCPTAVEETLLAEEPGEDKLVLLLLVTGCMQVCAYKLTDAILSSPMGVVRLMDMLMEREVCYGSDVWVHVWRKRRDSRHLWV